MGDDPDFPIHSCHESAVNRALTTFVLACATFAVLSLGWFADPNRLSPEEQEAANLYHARIVEEIERVPYRWGNWSGRDIELPASAVQLLRPTATLSRRYTNRETGRQVHVIIVHCSDVRDMIGHYPPICYPAHGWDMGDEVGTAAERFRTYHFSRVTQGVQVNMIVRNLFIAPGGKLFTSMDDLRGIESDRLRRQLGAAQVQLLTHVDEVDSEESWAWVEEMLEPVEVAIAGWSGP